MEPIEVLVATITALNGIKKLLSESDSEIERRQLKEKQRELEGEINRLKSKIAKLQERKRGREVSLNLYYCRNCGKLVDITSSTSLSRKKCLECGSSYGQTKFKTINMKLKYSFRQKMIALNECPRCRSINEHNIIKPYKCRNCGYKFHKLSFMNTSFVRL